MIIGWTGLPGSSKTTRLARACIDLLYRNKKHYEQTGTIRPLVSNIKFSLAVESEFDGFIKYWADVEELTPLRDCDVAIDEAMVYFDSRSWEHLSLDVRRWLAQHRKHGIEIYFTAQEFMQVDISFRRLVSDLFYLTKFAGSRDISATLPPPRWIWGVIRVQSVDPINYDEKTSKFQADGLPSFNLVMRSDTEIFDTRQEIKMSKWPPLKHIVRNCEEPHCNFIRTQHV